MPTLTRHAPAAPTPAAPADFRLDLNLIASIHGQVAGRERRRSCRMPRHASVVLCSPGGAPGAAPAATLTAVLRDLSATGVGVLYGRPLPIGETWIVGLPRPGEQPVWLRCQVMRHECVGDSLYHVGLAFRGPAEPLALSGAPASRPAPSRGWTALAPAEAAGFITPSHRRV